MKKKALFLLISLMLIFPNTVSAMINGSSASGSYSNSKLGSCKVMGRLVVCNTMYNIGIRLTVIYNYLDEKNVDQYQQLSNSVDLWHNSSSIIYSSGGTWSFAGNSSGQSKISANSNNVNQTAAVGGYRLTGVNEISERFGIEIKISDGQKRRVTIGGNTYGTETLTYEQMSSALRDGNVLACLLGNSDYCGKSGAGSLFTAAITDSGSGMVSGTSLTYDQLKKFADNNGSGDAKKCKEGDETQCHGVRVLIEPITQYYINQGTMSYKCATSGQKPYLIDGTAMCFTPTATHAESYCKRHDYGTEEVNGKKYCCDSGSSLYNLDGSVKCVKNSSSTKAIEIENSRISKGGNYIMTPTEASILFNGGSMGSLTHRESDWIAHSYYLTTDFKDIGIIAPSFNVQNYDWYLNSLSGKNIGYALNIFDIPGIANNETGSCSDAVKYSLTQAATRIDLSEINNNSVKAKELVNSLGKDFIVYTNKRTDDKKIERTLEWYVNTCTCSGVNEYYKEYKKGTKTLDEIGRIAILDLFEGTDFLERYNKKYEGSKKWNYSEYINQCYSGGGPEYSCDHLRAYNSSYDLSKKKKAEIEALPNNYFSAYNKKYGTNWTPSLYMANNCPYILPVDCTPEFSYGHDGGTGSRFASCHVGFRSYKDSDHWEECIFEDNGYYSIDVHKTSASGSLSYLDNTLSNQYCEVYCVEEFSSTSSLYGPTVTAGKNFVWPGNSNYLSGSRTCRTKEVKYDEFTSDLKSANENVRYRYALYRLEQMKQAANTSGLKTSSTKNCDYRCDHSSHGISCCISASYKSRTCSRDIYESKYSCSGEGKNKKCGWSRVKVGTREYECGSYTCDVKDTPYNHGYMKYPNGQNTYTPSFSVKGEDGRTYTYRNGSVYSWCSTTGRATSTNVSGTLSAYNSAKARPRGHYNTMVSCYSGWSTGGTTSGDNLYNVETSASVVYIGAGGNVYSYAGDLEPHTTYTRATIGLNCVNKIVDVVTGYTDSGPIIEKKEVKDCSGSLGAVTMQRKATTRFYLDDEVYRYVNKLNGMSFHASQLGTYNVGNFNYIDVGYGNFPVSFRTQPGIYGVGRPNGGELTLEYQKFAHTSANGSSATQTVISANSYRYGEDGQNKISCEYTVVRGHIVEDDPTPTPGTNHGGLTIVYRPIDLQRPFPSINADDRLTGSNWCDSGSCNHENDTVKDAILNNRGVVGDEIYNLEPMYSFTLTPRVINYIRGYNNNNAYDNETLDCDEGTGRHCTSEFLTDIIGVTGATGACVDTEAGRKTNFDTCRYKK